LPSCGCWKVKEKSGRKKNWPKRTRKTPPKKKEKEMKNSKVQKLGSQEVHGAKPYCC